MFHLPVEQCAPGREVFEALNLLQCLSFLPFSQSVSVEDVLEATLKRFACRKVFFSRSLLAAKCVENCKTRFPLAQDRHGVSV